MREKLLWISAFCFANLLNIPLHGETSDQGYISDLQSSYRPIMEPIDGLNKKSSDENTEIVQSDPSLNMVRESEIEEVQ